MATVTITDCTDRLDAYLTSQGKSLKTIGAYKSDVQVFANQMNLTKVDLQDLPSLATSWINQARQSRVVPASTICRRLASLRALGRALKLDSFLADYRGPTPIQTLAHPLPNGRHDLSKMFEVCTNQDQQVLLALMGLCGARVGEALSTRPSDINLREKRLRIFGKGDIERFVPLGEMCLTIFMEPVLLATISRRVLMLSYAERSARGIITSLAERAGINRPVSSHDLRATFATEVYQASGHDVELVRRLLGHRSLAYTQQYLGVGAQALRTAVNFMEED